MDWPTKQSFYSSPILIFASEHVCSVVYTGRQFVSAALVRRKAGERTARIYLAFGSRPQRVYQELPLAGRIVGGKGQMFPATRSHSTRTRKWRRWRSQLYVQLSGLHDLVRNELFPLIPPIRPMAP